MTLENLVKAKLLHQEAPDKSEIAGLLKLANERLKDSEKTAVYKYKVGIVYSNGVL